MDDDEDEIEEEAPQQVTVFFDEDDGADEDEEEDTSEADALTASYTAKGFADRALVDEQAKAEDEKKRKKRENLARLKQTALTMKSTIAKKERALHDLEIEIQKDRRTEIRERVVSDRQEVTLSEEELKKISEQEELNTIEKERDRERREDQFATQKREIDALKSSLSETVRAAASLEQELQRS